MTIFLGILCYLAIVNAVTFGLFAYDKRAAIADRRRIPEASLLLWARIGGWGAAKLAQSTLRHKTYKQPFGGQLNRIGVVQGIVVAAVLLGLVFLT